MQSYPAIDRSGIKVKLFFLSELDLLEINLLILREKNKMKENIYCCLLVCRHITDLWLVCTFLSFCPSLHSGFVLQLTCLLQKCRHVYIDFVKFTFALKVTKYICANLIVQTKRKMKP